MKKLLVIVTLILVLSGCGEKKEVIKKGDITYDSINYFKKEDNNLKIYTIFENTSDMKGKIEHVVFGAIDYDEKLIVNDHKEINIELKPGEQRLVILNLEIGDKMPKTVFNTPFNSKREELELVKSSKKEGKDITNLIKSREFYEDDESHFKVKLSKVPDGKEIKFIARSINNSIPLCLSYNKVKSGKTDYEFDCEYKLGEAEFVIELYAN